MFHMEYDAASNAALSKIQFLKNNPLGYFILSMMAGAFIGFGVMLTFTVGGYLNGLPYVKVVMGMTFGVALSLVVIAGGELFTGNNFVMAAGLLKKKISFADLIRLWIVCWIGNLVGSIIVAVIYHFTGLGVDAVGAFMASAAAAKMGAGALPLFMRGILCNILVCLAVWCGFRTKSDSAKLIMIFWCIFAFITSGFEHSIANMTLFTIALLNPCDAAVSLGGMFYNLLFVSLGNIVGGSIFVALPYFLGAKEMKKEEA